MAQKNWLIRTKNNQILGPATKEKVVDLVEKGSLTAEDEITCGNGYWFWVRERDLLEKYLYGDLPQTFNPISEAQDVLTAKTTPDGITASIVEGRQKAKKPKAAEVEKLPAGDDLAFPDDDDLAYPDMGGPSGTEELEPTDPLISDSSAESFEDNATGEIEMSEVTQELDRPKSNGPMLDSTPSKANPTAVEEVSEEDDENFLYPSEEDLEYPYVEGMEEDNSEAIEEDKTDPNMSIPGVTEEELSAQPGLQNFEEAQDELGEIIDDEISEESSAPKKRKLRGKKKGKKKRKVVEERKSNDRYLIYIALFILLAIGVVIYYYKSILNKPLPVIGMQEAHAQTISSLSKKKTSFL